jgi:hypothetical protein
MNQAITILPINVRDFHFVLDELGQGFHFKESFLAILHVAKSAVLKVGDPFSNNGVLVHKHIHLVLKCDFCDLIGRGAILLCLQNMFHARPEKRESRKDQELDRLLHI